MPDFFSKKWHIIALFVLAFLFASAILYYHKMLGIVSFCMLVFMFLLTFKIEASSREELNKYIAGLSHRVKRVGDEAFQEMPIGIVLYNENFEIEWMNTYFDLTIARGLEIGDSLKRLSGQLVPFISEEEETVQLITLDQRTWKLFLKKDRRLLYFFDVTEQVKIQKRYEYEKTVLAIIYLDNYEEVTQGMNDQTKSQMIGKVTDILNHWADEFKIYLKRISSEKYLAVMSQATLEMVEKTKFSVLDEVREINAKQNVPLTLSIGVGAGDGSPPEIGHLAQSSLDLALGRGGDQTAIKRMNGKVKFYGGKTNPIEKRTRVRARVISHALRELVLESDRVIVMGHKNPDMDALGAAIGVLKVAEANQKECAIVLNPNEIHMGISRLVDEMKKDEIIWSHFITPEQAVEECTTKTLLVIVDTHKPSLVIEPRLLTRSERVVVIDHHRRGEEFIKDPVLVYMEPYASSTSELVTEILEYQPIPIKMSMLQSTALLAGIIVDTKSFTLRTGSRTFDAASYLRSHGADTILVQRLLKEELDQYIKRSKLIERADVYQGGIAIATSTGDETYDQVLIAQAADTLLTLSGIVASFVISKRTDGKVAISARSLGDVNVQLIMESLDGGGHLTNAAAQLENTSLEEAEKLLKEKIVEYLEGGEKS